MFTPEEIRYILKLVRAARLVAGKHEPGAFMSERDRKTVADLILSGWSPLAAVEFVELNCPPVQQI